jgi:hypothetical protein
MLSKKLFLKFIPANAVTCVFKSLRNILKCNNCVQGRTLEGVGCSKLLIDS